MAIKNKMQKQKSAIGDKNGFALLIAVIFMSVMLSLGLALSALGYKQQVLASAAIASQYAFYAADAGMECALYADQKQNLFDYASHDQNNQPAAAACDDALATVPPGGYSYDSERLSLTMRFSLDAGTSHPRCADVTIYKYGAPQGEGITTNIFSQGYDVSCAALNAGVARYVSRGINSHY